MLVPLSWLREHVAVTASADEIADKLTLAGVEVSSVTRATAPFRGVLSGLITKREAHPGADRLIVCQVEIGSGRTCQIVTGDMSLQEGMKVPMAPPGAVLPGDRVMKEVQLRGIRSEGMACSVTELLLGESHREGEGVLVLDEGVAPGRDMAEVLDWDDWVLDLDPTPNYAHCLGVRGVAREVAAAFRVPLVRREVPKLGGKDRRAFVVRIEDAEGCPRYAGALARKAKVDQSPPLIRWRLHVSGVRPINNVVDATNYVMLETGQPLHAFDFEKLRGRAIIVRKALPGERIVTLDGVERILEGDLAICDEGGVVAVAGVMGGESSGVTDGTTTILFESAYFLPKAVMRSSRRLGLRTEASARFERGVDPAGQVRALERALEILVEQGAVEPGAIVDAHPAPVEARVIAFRPWNCDRILGVKVPDYEKKRIFRSLGCAIGTGPSGWKVRAPSFRPDLSSEIDLVEEIARMHGYDKIPATLPRGCVTKGGRSSRKRFDDELREVLVGCGLNEAITYSFMDPRSLDALGVPEGHPWRNFLRISNPIREEHSVMRTSLIPGLVGALSNNLTRGAKDVRLFEIGAVYLPSGDAEKLPREPVRLGAIACGSVRPRNWATPSEEADFYFFKGILEEARSRIGGGGDLAFARSSHPFLHPARQASIVWNGKEAGFAGEIHPRALKAFDVRVRAVALEVDLETIASRGYPVFKRHQALPKYPAVERDMAVIAPGDVRAGDVYDAILESSGPFLEELVLFDVYEGDPIPRGKKSLAFSMRYRAPDRTLTDKEVDLQQRRIIEQLEAAFGLQLR